MSAQKTAAKIQPGSVVRWDRLEKAAFAGHPSVLSALEGARASQRKTKPRWQIFAAVPVAVLMLFAMLTPILGMAAIARGRFQEYEAPPEDMIPLAGFFYACAALAILLWMIVWFASGRRYSGFAMTFAVMTVVLGALTAFTLADRGAEASVAGWQSWLGAVIAAIALAVVFGALQLLGRSAARASRGGAAAELSPNMVAQLQARRAAVAGLSEADRAAAKGDLEAATNDLERRGLISADEAERARSTELGGLALRMRNGSAQGAVR